MMINNDIHNQAVEKFVSWYGRNPAFGAYAPGRVEVLGNHTDYNEGFVLSAAISFGTFFFCAPADRSEPTMRLVAGDLMEEAVFSLENPAPFSDRAWPNYVMGVAAQLHEAELLNGPLDCLFYGNVPLGSGLSSSAALEMSAGLALLAVSGTSMDRIALARIGQKAEHEYVGARTGLLDQISSLYGKRDALVKSDFRSLKVDTVPLPTDVVFVVCDTGTRHSLGESAYNARREACERATASLREQLDHEVRALRDVSMQELKEHAGELDDEARRRAAHVVGENERVLAGSALLESNDIVGFGRLLYESHESSRKNFENSCPELDAIVASARRQTGVYGARLSGGGFGGSAVVLMQPSEVQAVIDTLGADFEHEFGYRFEAQVIEASDGARTIGTRTGGKGSESQGLPDV